MDSARVLEALGLGDQNPGVFAGEWLQGTDGTIEVLNPATGERIASVGQASPDEYEKAVNAAVAAFERWRMLPPPKRGDYVRRIGDALRTHKEALGTLVSLEMGKIRAEGEGEVQEMIDICDFAVGLSRQLYGLTMASERPLHRMYEQWHPLGPVGVITAFNFPVAVWSWNAAIAAGGHCPLEALFGGPVVGRSGYEDLPTGDGRHRVRGCIRLGGGPGVCCRRPNAQ
jgi:aldehyde dehydrogenase (NAD+)